MSPSPNDLADGVPFSFFVSLLREISKVAPHKVKNKTRTSSQDYPAKSVFVRWTNHLREKFSPLPPGTTSIVFRLLFPHEDHRRKYDMQEPRLAQCLAQALGINASRLKNWSSSGTAGCLGEEIKQMLEMSCPTAGSHISPLSIAQVDELLDELAALSGYTHFSIKKKYPSGERRSRASILKSLFHTLSPLDAGFLTQIILKDLRPILYPLQDSQMHYTSALLDYNTKAIKMLSEQDALQVWDPSGWMLKMYRVRSTLDEVAEEFEKPAGSRETAGPRLGTMVTLPKSEKGRSPRHALKTLSASSQIWAETKYDGERAQIHVEILQPGNKPKISIFSKSKRDSTFDRKGVHEIILRALDLCKTSGSMRDECKVKSGVILDAEMVACNGDNIDEFWRIRGLIERSALGVRRNAGAVAAESQAESCVDQESQLSMLTANIENRHLALVFFDVLMLNSDSLLQTPYSKRREILETLINVSPGEALLAQRSLISLPSSASVPPRSKDPPEILVSQLDSAFAKCIGRAEEGLILKAAESRYHDWRMPWVKLKRDYIPGYGDALDMVLVGASWDRDRGRELRVGTDTFTTFYIGGIKPGSRLHLCIYFTVSYGLNRRQLEELNFTIKRSEHHQFSKMNDRVRAGLPYTFDLYHGIQSPTIILQNPMLVELVGAGFTKSSGSRYYELRFPRLLKVHRPIERPWTSGTTLPDLHKIACAAVGRDPSNKVAKDAVTEMWGKPCSPGAKSCLKRKAITDLWEERLAELDGRSWKRREESSSEDEPEIPPVARTQRPLQAVTNTPIKKKRVEIIDLCTPSPKTPSPSASGPSSSLDSENVHHSSPPTSSPVKPSLLENSVVWIARSKERTADQTSAALQALISPACRLHSLHSLLVSCGWHTGSRDVAWANVQRGIIFLEAEWEDYVVKMLKGISVGIGNRKPIHVLDVFGEELYSFS